MASIYGILDPYEDLPDAPCTRDFPGEIFRELKECQIKQSGEYRTRRLVLAVWDALATEGASHAGNLSKMSR